jgi:hypothetical protein
MRRFYSHSMLFCLLLFLEAIALSCAHSKVQPLLNSEMIKEKFGSYGIRILATSNEHLRVSELYSINNGKEVCRTFAVSIFPENMDKSIADEHRLITKEGKSIGALFKERGFVINKKHRYFGILKNIPKNIFVLMGNIMPQPLTIHIYDLIVAKDGKESLYATISEIHNSDYLSIPDISKLYFNGAKPKHADREIQNIFEIVQSAMMF